MRNRRHILYSLVMALVVGALVLVPLVSCSDDDETGDESTAQISALTQEITDLTSKVSELEGMVQELQDIQEILQLEHSYALANDTHDPDLYASIWADDAVLDFDVLGMVMQGKEEIRQFAEMLAGYPTFSRHWVHNADIVVDGDTATGHFLWESAFTYAMTGEAAWSSGTSDEEFVRTAEGWKIQKKVTNTDYLTAYDKGWVEQPNLMEP